MQGFAGTPGERERAMYDFFARLGAAGAVFPRQQQFYVSVDSGTRPVHRASRPGTYVLRSWVNDVTPPSRAAADDACRRRPPDARLPRARHAVRRRPALARRSRTASVLVGAALYDPVNGDRGLPASDECAAPIPPRQDARSSSRPPTTRRRRTSTRSGPRSCRTRASQPVTRPRRPRRRRRLAPPGGRQCVRGQARALAVAASSDRGSAPSASPSTAGGSASCDRERRGLLRHVWHLGRHSARGAPPAHGGRDATRRGRRVVGEQPSASAQVDRVAVVTGASCGIGAEIARALAGARLALRAARAARGAPAGARRGDRRRVRALRRRRPRGGRRGRRARHGAPSADPAAREQRRGPRTRRLPRMRPGADRGGDAHRTISAASGACARSCPRSRRPAADVVNIVSVAGRSRFRRPARTPRRSTPQLAFSRAASGRAARPRDPRAHRQPRLRRDRRVSLRRPMLRSALLRRLVIGPEQVARHVVDVCSSATSARRSCPRGIAPPRSRRPLRPAPSRGSRTGSATEDRATPFRSTYQPLSTRYVSPRPRRERFGGVPAPRRRTRRGQNR